MNHSFDTYRLYSNEKNFTYSVRVRVRMKDEIDIDIMRHVANVAIKSYRRRDSSQPCRWYRYTKYSLRFFNSCAYGTYIVNYTGRIDWGEVANYVESYVIIVEGHLLLEITSMADKIFVSFM